jgi:hypothetical protein
MVKVSTPWIGERYSMDDVVERSYNLLGEDDTTRDFLAFCSATRNELVHIGRFDTDSQSIVLLLKDIVRACIARLWHIKETYPSRTSLTEFFRHRLLSKSDLVERKRVIDSILAQTSSKNY